VSGLTHSLYKYPARFSPAFARAAIEVYSRPNDVVLDPFMGGGTTIVEAIRLGRRAVGADINQLAVFVTKAKVLRPSPEDLKHLRLWADNHVMQLRYIDPLIRGKQVGLPTNLDTQEMKHLYKLIALSLESIEIGIMSCEAQVLARCALLNTCQQLLDGPRRPSSARDYRERLSRVVHETADAVKGPQCSSR